MNSFSFTLSKIIVLHTRQTLRVYNFWPLLKGVLFKQNTIDLVLLKSNDNHVIYYTSYVLTFQHQTPLHQSLNGFKIKNW